MKPAQTSTEAAPARRTSSKAPRWGLPKRWNISLFWRTFFLLVLLLSGCILAWLQTLRVLEFEPRVEQSSRQIASLVNLSRAALVHAEKSVRPSLIKTIDEQEGVRIVLRERGDQVTPFHEHPLDLHMAENLQRRLGGETVLAEVVNEQLGLWVGFEIDGESYWLRADRARVNLVSNGTWLIWFIIAMASSLMGTALITGFINRPLKRLSLATERIHNADFEASTLNEEVRTSEIRAVNVGFNRMARQLAKFEQDRVIMLAGISHDLRTPLARLRLETELSVRNEQARELMASDIEQLDRIIDKFLQYARPQSTLLRPVRLLPVVERCVRSLRHWERLHIHVEVAPQLKARADTVELGRVLTNLLENAGHYAVTNSIARVMVSAHEMENWVCLQVRDYGAGVPEALLTELTKPFFRGNSARTAVTGVGLGLAIAQRPVQRMQGQFTLSNAPGGGLIAHIYLQSVTPDDASDEG